MGLGRPMKGSRYAVEEGRRKRASPLAEGPIRVVRLLLKAGARVSDRNGSGLTALEMGIVSGSPGLEELIAAGARLDAKKEAYKNNPGRWRWARRRRRDKRTPPVMSDLT